MVEKDNPMSDQDKNKCIKKGVGRTMAETAIDDMSKDKAKEQADKEKGHFDGGDVEAFLDYCYEKDANPLEVVSYIAHKSGIKLSEDTPKDEAQRKTYVFLKAVLRRVVTGLLLNLAERRGFGIEALLKAALDTVDDDSEAYGCNEGEDTDCSSCRHNGFCKVLNYSFAW